MCELAKIITILKISALRFHFLEEVLVMLKTYEIHLNQ